MRGIAIARRRQRQTKPRPKPDRALGKPEIAGPPRLRTVREAGFRGGAVLRLDDSRVSEPELARPRSISASRRLQILTPAVAMRGPFGCDQHAEAHAWAKSR